MCFYSFLFLLLFPSSCYWSCFPLVVTLCLWSFNGSMRAIVRLLPAACSCNCCLHHWWLQLERSKLAYSLNHYIRQSGWFHISWYCYICRGQSRSSSDVSLELEYASWLLKIKGIAQLTTASPILGHEQNKTYSRILYDDGQHTTSPVLRVSLRAPIGVQ